MIVKMRIYNPVLADCPGQARQICSPALYVVPTVGESCITAQARTSSKRRQLTQAERPIEELEAYSSVFTKITPAVLNDMVKAVYVHAPDKPSRHRELNCRKTCALIPRFLKTPIQPG